MEFDDFMSRRSQCRNGILGILGADQDVIGIESREGKYSYPAFRQWVENRCENARLRKRNRALEPESPPWSFVGYVWRNDFRVADNRELLGSAGYAKKA